MTERYIIINHATPKKDVVGILEKFATILGIVESCDRYEFIGECLRYDIPWAFQDGVRFVRVDVALYENRECFTVDLEKGTYINTTDLIQGDRVNVETTETEIERQRKDIIGFVNSIADSTQYSEETKLDLLRGALLKHLGLSPDNIISDEEAIAKDRWFSGDPDFGDSEMIAALRALN